MRLPPSHENRKRFYLSRTLHDKTTLLLSQLKHFRRGQPLHSERKTETLMMVGSVPAELPIRQLKDENTTHGADVAGQYFISALSISVGCAQEDVG